MRRRDCGPSWVNVELESLKLELRDRVVAVADREAELGLWEQELERREAKLDRQRASLRRRRLQVVKRLIRLRGRVPVVAASENGDAPALDEELVAEAADAKTETASEERPALRRRKRTGSGQAAGSAGHATTDGEPNSRSS